MRRESLRAVIFIPPWRMNHLSVGVAWRRMNRLSVGVPWRRSRGDWGVRGHMSVVILGFVTVGGGAVEIRRVSAWVSLVIVLHRSSSLVFPSIGLGVRS